MGEGDKMNQKMLTIDKKKLIPYFLLLPAFIYYILIWFGPVTKSIFGSFTDGSGNFTLKYYKEVLGSEIFRTALINTTLFTVMSVTIQFVLALGLAVFLNRKFKGSNILLFIALIPMAIPPAAVVMLWQTGFRTHGWVNSILYNLNIIKEPISWFAMEGYQALAFLVLIDTWTVLPSVTIILLAGLQNFNNEYKEAAHVFGASRWRAFKDIVIPILKPTIVTAIVLRMIAAIQVWLIAVMLFGYGRMPFLVERVAYYVEEVKTSESSYSIALTYSVIVTVIVMIAAVIYLKISNRRKEVPNE